MQTGLYRVRDTNGDDELDDVQAAPRASTAAAANTARTPCCSRPTASRSASSAATRPRSREFDTSRVPPIWGEDHLLPRMPDGNGFMTGVLGPGGAIYSVDPDGKNWELLSVGFRNQYDAAFNRDGDLFTYDADMEWDFNTPWYRPTRVCLAASGSRVRLAERRRQVAGVLPRQPARRSSTSAPARRPASTFGYGAKFPAKYQDAFFICDWSYGKLYAVHLKPDGCGLQGRRSRSSSPARRCR